MWNRLDSLFSSLLMSTTKIEITTVCNERKCNVGYKKHFYDTSAFVKSRVIFFLLCYFYLFSGDLIL